MTLAVYISLPSCFIRLALSRHVTQATRPSRPIPKNARALLEYHLVEEIEHDSMYSETYIHQMALHITALNRHFTIQAMNPLFFHALTHLLTCFSLSPAPSLEKAFNGRKNVTLIYTVNKPLKSNIFSCIQIAD